MKQACQELHGLLKEAKEVKRQLAQEIETGVVAVGHLVETTVVMKLNDMSEQVGRAIDQSVASVNRRFDTLGDVLLGEDAKSRRRGEPTLLEIAERIRDVRLFSRGELEANRESEQG